MQFMLCSSLIPRLHPAFCHFQYSTVHTRSDGKLGGAWEHSVLEVTESWAGPGNIPYWKWQKAGWGLGTRLLCTCCLHVHVTCAMHMLHARAWHMLHVWLHVVMYIQEHIRTGDLSKSVPLR